MVAEISKKDQWVICGDSVLVECKSLSMMLNGMYAGNLSTAKDTCLATFLSIKLLFLAPMFLFLEELLKMIMLMMPMNLTLINLFGLR